MVLHPLHKEIHENKKGGKEQKKSVKPNIVKSVQGKQIRLKRPARPSSISPVAHYVLTRTKRPQQDTD